MKYEAPLAITVCLWSFIGFMWGDVVAVLRAFDIIEWPWFIVLLLFWAPLFGVLTLYLVIILTRKP